VKIVVLYSDYTEGVYNSKQDAEDAILEALAESILVENVTNEDGSKLYSCLWGVELQEEV